MVYKVWNCVDPRGKPVPSTIIQPSTRTVRGAKDYYVNALWSGSLCKQYGRLRWW